MAAEEVRALMDASPITATVASSLKNVSAILFTLCEAIQDSIDSWITTSGMAASSQKEASFLLLPRERDVVICETMLVAR